LGHGSPPRSAGIDFCIMVDMFASERLVSILTGVDHIVINDPTKSKVFDKWDCALIPKEPVQRSNQLWIWGLGINEASKHKEVAWLFVEWASSELMQERMGVNCTPPRLALWKTKPFRQLKAQGWVETSQ